MARLFGTDGVRGIANRDLSCELAFKIGAVGACVLTNEVHSPRILIGMDTRRSGEMLAAALTAGICSVGGDVVRVGVLPTPALAYLVRLYEADAAVMISASHNPMEYNGIKWFDGCGFKLSDEIEDRIEAMIASDEELPHPEGRDVGTVIPAPRAARDYCDYLVSKSTGRFDGLKVVLDCANGANYKIAPLALEELGAEVFRLGTDPNGLNINYQCGSLHPETLQAKVREVRADIGLALDGDADRLLVVDEKGRLLDGDQIMAICADDLMKKGKLNNNTLVGTVMSNMALEVFMQQRGGTLLRSKVGDRYVIEAMRQNNANLGGEQSGHLIFRDYGTTGDGLLAALQILRIMRETGKPLSELASILKPYPQVLLNVKVTRKTPFEECEKLMQTQKDVEAQLAGKGRVLLRYSGTENLCRIMVEGENEELVRRSASLLAEVADLELR